MSHDPLCGEECTCSSVCEDVYCNCDTIARVRADERAKTLDAAREAVMRTCGHTKYEGCSPCLHDDAIAAIDALRDQPADQTGYNLPDAP